MFSLYSQIIKLPTEIYLKMYPLKINKNYTNPFHYTTNTLYIIIARKRNKQQAKA